jgi:hypothetical protein
MKDKRVWSRTPAQLRGQQRANAKRGLRGWFDRTSRRLGDRETVELAQVILDEWARRGRSSAPNDSSALS